MIGAPMICVLAMWGNSPIITTVFQILLNRIDLGMALPEAVAAPRASQRNTATVQAEPAFLASPEAAGLMALRHVFASPATPEIGAATGVEFLPDGQVVAVAEPVRRGGGSAAVVTPSQLGTGQRPYGVRLLPERDQMVSAPLGS
jgi:gamma-glutamyltranspeptidase / glutathione hydrolase